MAQGEEKLRVDKWLWHARFCKSRGIAGELASSGRLRINGVRCLKPAQTVRPGDVLTLPAGGRIRLVRVEELGVRRGPAPEAQALYTDLDQAADPTTEGAPTSTASPAPRPAGRPTKKNRREIDRLSRPWS